MVDDFTYEQGILFAIKVVSSLADEDVDEFMSGYCQAAQHLLINIYETLTAASTAEETD